MGLLATLREINSLVLKLEDDFPKQSMLQGEVPASCCVCLQPWCLAVTCPCVRGEGVLRGTACSLAFWRDGKKTADSFSERVGKHCLLLLSSRTHYLGKRKQSMAGCTMGGGVRWVLLLWKSLLSFEFLLPGQNRYSKRPAASSWLRITVCHLAPTPLCIPVLLPHCPSALSAGENQSGTHC